MTRSEKEGTKPGQPLEIWWCLAHTDKGENQHRCLDEDYEYGDVCRMVRMQLTQVVASEELLQNGGGSYT